MAKPRVKSRITAKQLPRNFLSLFKKDAILLANNKTRELAAEIYLEAQEVIYEQRYNWAPLSDKYKKYKERNHLDARIYIATGEYVEDGIGMWEDGGAIFVGPKPGIHEPSGLSYQHLAKIHEYGTWNIPARPLWRPLMSAVLRRSRKMRREYNKGLQYAASRRARVLKRRKNLG